MLTGCSHGGKSAYFFDEDSGECWVDIKKLNEPVYFGETKTIDQALKNAEKAIKYYFGEDVNVNAYKPFGITYFVKENVWFVLTEYDPDSVGGGIAFTIDGKTGEISDYELNE